MNVNLLNQKSLSFIPLIFFMSLVSACSQKQPQQYLDEYYVWFSNEGAMTDPLIVAGDEVVPLVIEAVKNKDMVKRPQAISFLGNSGDREAIPVLESIINDKSDELRDWALGAIYQIDNELGKEIARKFEKEEGALGSLARSIITSKYYRVKRTYAEALISYYTNK